MRPALALAAFLLAAPLAAPQAAPASQPAPAPQSPSAAASAPRAGGWVGPGLAARARSSRPTVVALPTALQVSWSPATRTCRVNLQRKGGRWKRATTTISPATIPNLVAGRRYRVRLRCKAGRRWLATGKASSWVRPLAPAPGNPSAGTSGGGELPSDPTGTWPQSPGTPDPGSQPPANATVIWVDPSGGSDSGSGARTDPLATLTAAWARIPAGTQLASPVWIQLLPGTIPEAGIPVYWERRWGSPVAPIVINAAAGAHTVRLTAFVNVFDTRYLTFTGVDIITVGDAFHCDSCSFVTINGAELDGAGAAHEVIKANQSDHLTITGNTIHGAYENAVDFVAVAHATITDNVMYAADDWCAYVKGGSAYVLFARNELHHCGTGGFTAGQGTGFEYMVAPWLRYEAYAVTVVDNVIHDTEGAGLGVNGGFGIRMAYNTLYRVGSRSHAVEFVHGARSCDGNSAQCAANHDAGGWGSATDAGQWIPSRHVYFYDNVVYNPPGFVSLWSHFAVAGLAHPPATSGVPDPSMADDDLLVVNNVLWNGPPSLDTGFADPTFVVAHNWVNTLEPALVAPGSGDFRLVPGSPAAALAAVAVPDFDWTGSGAPSEALPALRTSGALGASRG